EDPRVAVGGTNDVDHAGPQRRDQRRMIGKDGHVAFASREQNLLRLARKQHLLGADQLECKRLSHKLLFPKSFPPKKRERRQLSSSSPVSPVFALTSSGACRPVPQNGQKKIG